MPRTESPVSSPAAAARVCGSASSGVRIGLTSRAASDDRPGEGGEARSARRRRLGGAPGRRGRPGRGSARRARTGTRAAALRAGSAPARRPRRASGGSASHCGARAATCRRRSAAERAAARRRAARASSRGRGCRRPGCSRRDPRPPARRCRSRVRISSSMVSPEARERLRRDRLGAVLAGRDPAFAVSADRDRFDPGAAQRDLLAEADRVGESREPDPRARAPGRAGRSCRSRCRARSGRAGRRGCRVPSPDPITNGGFGSGTPGWEITSASSTSSGRGSASTSCRAPSAPSLPPSVEAKISVWVRRERPRSSASPSRVAVADALVAAPGPSAESRWATTRIVRSDVPGSVRITFSSFTSSPSKLESNDWVETSPPSIAENRSRTRSATALVARRPRRPVGREVRRSIAPSARPRSRRRSAWRPAVAADSGSARRRT